MSFLSVLDIDRFEYNNLYLNKKEKGRHNKCDPFFRIRKKEKWNILKRNQRFISMYSAIDSVARDLTPLVADLFFRSTVIVFLASRDIASLLYTIYSSHLYFSRRVETHVYVPCALYSILFHCRCIFECFDEKRNRADNDDVFIEIPLGIYVSFEFVKVK